MSSFSITEARKYASATYGRHFILLLKASALVGISLWLCSAAPDYVAQKLGVTQSVFSIDWSPLAETIQGEFVLNFTTGMFLAKYAVFSVWGALQAAPYVWITIFLIWLLAWALQLFLLVGFMNLCLHIKDNEKGLLDLLFKVSKQQVIRIVGGIVVLMLSAIVILQIVPFFLMLFSTPKIFWGMLFLGFIVFPSLWAWYMKGVFFYPLCIIDTPTSGVRGAVRLSKKISSGHFFRIWAAFMMMLFVVAIEALILLVILALVISFFNGGASFNLKVHPGIIAFCFYPFCFLYYSFIYRALNPKQSVD